MIVERARVRATRCICERCTHRWNSIASAPPGSCPKCHSRAWNGPKRVGRPPSPVNPSNIGHLPPAAAGKQAVAKAKARTHAGVSCTTTHDLPTSASRNAVAYLRVSGASQIDGTGFSRQFDACAALVVAKEFTLTHSFREEAVTGVSEAVERPAFLAMVAHLLESGTTIIVVEGLDRLAREYRVQEHLLFYLASKGLTLYAANTGEDITAAMLADPMKRFLIQIQGLVAELDKSMIVAKLKKGRQLTKIKDGVARGYSEEAAIVHGRCEGRKPFGYNPKLPGEGPILAEMLRLRSAGLRPKDIAAALNIDGVPPRSGSRWLCSVVAKILRRDHTKPPLIRAVESLEFEDANTPINSRKGWEIQNSQQQSLRSNRAPSAYRDHRTEIISARATVEGEVC